MDRWDRRRILLTSELVAGLALASVPVAIWCGVLTLPHLVIGKPVPPPFHPQDGHHRGQLGLGCASAPVRVRHRSAAARRDPLQLGAIGAACAFAGALWNVVVITYLTVLVPNELLGRVTSAAMTLSWGVMPLASLGAGYLLTTLGPTGSVWALTAVILAAAITATTNPAIRRAPPHL